jgi:hypothetical protein
MTAMADIPPIIGQPAIKKPAVPKIQVGPKPTAEDFTAAAVNRAVVARAIGHPATTYPMAGAILAAVWGVIFGWTEVGLMAMVGLGFLSLAAGVWHVFIRGEKTAAEYVNKMRALREQFKRTEAVEVEESCRQAGFDEGAKEAGELASAYEKLSQFLSQQTGQARALTVERYALLAEDTYFQGVAILRKSLALFSALKSVDAQALEAEVAQWRKDSARAINPEALQRKIAANEKTVKLCQQNEAKLQSALAECNGLEAELKSAHLELVDLFSGKEDQPLPSSGAESRLRQAVEAARRVEDRLTQLGEPDHSADQAYLEAGQKTKPKNSTQE